RRCPIFAISLWLCRAAEIVGKPFSRDVCARGWVNMKKLAMLFLSLLLCCFAWSAGAGSTGEAQAEVQPNPHGYAAHSQLLEPLRRLSELKTAQPGQRGTGPEPPAADRGTLTVQDGLPGSIESVAFSTDGRLIASGGQDDKVHLWEAASGTLIRVFRGHSGP